MINSILSKPKGPFSAQELSLISNSSIIGNKDIFISNINSIKDAAKGEITFVDNPKYIEQISNTKASGLILSNEHIDKMPKLDILFVSKNPYLSYAKVVEKFYPINRDYSYSECKNKDISKTSKLSEDCFIYNNVTIKENSIISANSSIGPNVFIGENCYIGRNVSISNSYLESNIVIQDGSIIGQDGFGYAHDNNKYVKIPQIGIVKIGSNVEIGCNCTIDRGSLKYTEIREGVKIDNLVHIAHNVIIKENTVIAGQTGIAGSTVIGRNVMIGGQVGIAGHINVGDNVKIGAQAGVTKNIDDGKTVSGTPAVDLNLYLKKSIILNKMVKKNE